LITILLSNQLLAGGSRNVSRYLKEPAVKWENNVITGELKNVPVKGLLEELLRKQGSNWEVIGDLKGTLNISFDDMTINDSIRKIMRLGHYNFVLIFDRDELTDNPLPHRIKNLTIYQKDKIIRFSRTSQLTVASQKKQINKPPKAARQRTTALSPIPKNLAEGKRSRTTLPTGPTKKEIMALNNEIKAFADEMLAAKKITQEEYNELVGEIER
jgi:hypothetical protein